MSRTDKTPCPRCGGSGYIPRFKHVEGGICFRCKGEGIVEGKASPETRAKHLSERARKLLAGVIEGSATSGRGAKELVDAGLVERSGRKLLVTERGLESHRRAVAAGLVPRPAPRPQLSLSTQGQGCHALGCMYCDIPDSCPGDMEETVWQDPKVAEVWA